ncbi:hypothetical protein SAMN05216588_101267 [Pseudomonas flavescens]|uniref:Uncharacterized protein n=1 Tax=Phytopseudomonas flavescens TaxID=29435 RepID=A0A1G7XTU3_9GAMM|nr:hypothetical protein [Pseudomonas flavescens]SDG87453.1 hypothetical protein SAMN05216588_101267 [Pseudomonas flavescens]
MSFNSHRRKLLDERSPLSHRASHARSCALLVAQKLGLQRDDVIEQVARKTGVDLDEPRSPAELLIALVELESMRLVPFSTHYDPQ